MTDDIPVTPGTGANVATDDVGGRHFQIVKLDVGTDGVSVPVDTTGLPVVITDIPLATDAATETTLANILASSQSIQTSVTALFETLTGDEPNRLLVEVAESVLPTGAATAALQTTLNGHVDGIEGLIGTTNTTLTTIDGHVDGIEASVDGIETLIGTTNSSLTTIDGRVDGLETLATATNTKLDTLHTDVDSLETITGAIQTSVQIMDDWDESDRAKVNPIVGQAGIAAGTGVDGVTVPRVTLATNVALPAGTNAIGKLAANSGIDIGDVDVTSISAGDNTIGRVKLTDGTDVADILDLTNSNPLAVAITDGAGTQITSFGGGTQYDEGNTDASITGTAMLWEDTSDTLRAVSAAKPLPTAVVSALPAGNNNIGDVDVASLPALVAGTANIGDVDVLTVPADPFGANADAVVAAGAVGSIQAKLRRLTTDLDAVNTAVAAIKTSVEIMDDWDETDRNKVNPIVGQAGVAAGAGAVSATVQRVTHASDDPVTTSVQLIDDTIFTDDTGFTPATSKVSVIGLQADESSTDSVDEGDAGAPRMTLDRKQIVTVQPHAAGGLSTAMFTGSDGSGGVLVATKQTVTASAAALYGWYIYNPNSSAMFVHFYNTDTVTVGTTNPQMTLTIPALAAANILGAVGISFSTAISMAATTTAGGNTAPGTGLDVVVFYK